MKDRRSCRCVHLSLVLVTLVSLLRPVSADDSTLIPREAYFGATEKSQVQLDPGGTRIGYLHGDTLVTAPVADVSRTSHPFPDVAVSSWRWSPSGAVLAVGRPRNDTVAGTRLWMAADGEPSPRAVLGDESYVQIRLLATSPRHPLHATALLVSESDDEDASGVFRIDLTDGSTDRRIAIGDFSNWVFDQELRLRAATRRNDLYDIRIYRHLGDGVFEAIAPDESLAVNQLGRHISNVVGASAEGDRLWIVHNYGRDTAALWAVDVASGDQELLLESDQVDLLWAGATLHPESGEVQAAVAYQGDLTRWSLDPDVRDDFEYLESADSGDVSFVGRSSDDTTWLIRYLDGGPMRYVLFDREQRRLQPLFRDYDRIPATRIAYRTTIHVETPDGLRLPCQVYLPPDRDPDRDGRPDVPLPTVFYVHGGPWVGFLTNSWFANRNFQLLTDRGYAVVNVEFRGATGFGRRFIESSNLQWAGDMHQDLLTIADQVVALGISDPERLAMWGWSYGGYATVAALTFAPEKFTCGVAMYGVYDLETFGLLPHVDVPWWHRRTGNPHTASGRGILRGHSPLPFTDRIQRPLLMTHGGLDAVTPQSQSDRLFEALEAHDRDVLYLVYPDEPHDYRRSESWVSFWAHAEPFLARHLGGRDQPPGNDRSLVEIESRDSSSTGPTGS